MLLFAIKQTIVDDLSIFALVHRFNRLLTSDMSSGGWMILDDAEVVAIIATGLLCSLDLEINNNTPSSKFDQ